jgi:S1-C subfamily serine protease
MRSRSVLVRSTILGGALLACSLLRPARAAADPAPASPAAEGSHGIPNSAVSFSNLVVRLDGRDEIGVAGADYRVRVLERMRSQGFNAVGAENLVFGRDDSKRAEYLVGGTVREVSCQKWPAKMSCRIGVEWQVLDVPDDTVVYKVMSRAAVTYLDLTQKDHMAAMLIDGALDALLARTGFRHALTTHERRIAGGEPATSFPAATLPACAPGRRVGESADDLLGDVVVVRGHDGFGSGVFVSPEGLVMTAAHVVDADTLKLRLRDGTEVDALPIRVAPREDVALLRPVTPLKGHACAQLRADTPASGAEVYAAGAPASLELAFSLTRGIVSGYPVIEGQRRLQTDAPVNPGNSGGPISDASGAVVGIVSFKLVSRNIEGVAFAVPTHESLAALGLSIGTATDPALLTAPAAMESPAPAAPLIADLADPVPSLDPSARRSRASHRYSDSSPSNHDDTETSPTDRKEKLPAGALAMRWGGLSLALAGIAGGVVAYGAANGQPASDVSSSSAFTSLGVTCFAVGGIGLLLFGLSYTIKPVPVSNTTTLVEIGPTGAGLHGTF